VRFVGVIRELQESAGYEYEKLNGYSQLIRWVGQNTTKLD
jgi:hypothetical protein